MDMRMCVVCGRGFDFDKGGLASDAGYVVCGARCAKKGAAARGHCYAIHDATDAIVDTDASKERVVRRIGLKVATSRVEVVLRSQLRPGARCHVGTSVKWRYVKRRWWDPRTWSLRWKTIVAEHDRAEQTAIIPAPHI